MSGIDVDVLAEAIGQVGGFFGGLHMPPDGALSTDLETDLARAIVREYDRIADRWAEAAERDRHPDGPRNEMGRPARVETPRERAAREKREAES